MRRTLNPKHPSKPTDSAWAFGAFASVGGACQARPRVSLYEARSRAREQAVAGQRYYRRGLEQPLPSGRGSGNPSPLLATLDHPLRDLANGRNPKAVGWVFEVGD